MEYINKRNYLNKIEEAANDDNDDRLMKNQIIEYYKNNIENRSELDVKLLNLLEDDFKII